MSSTAAAANPLLNNQVVFVQSQVQQQKTSTNYDIVEAVITEVKGNGCISCTNNEVTYDVASRYYDTIFILHTDKETTLSIRKYKLDKLQKTNEVASKKKKRIGVINNLFAYRRKGWYYKVTFDGNDNVILSNVKVLKEYDTPNVSRALLNNMDDESEEESEDEEKELVRKVSNEEEEEEDGENVSLAVMNIAYRAIITDGTICEIETASNGFLKATILKLVPNNNGDIQYKVQYFGNKSASRQLVGIDDIVSILGVEDGVDVVLSGNDIIGQALNCLFKDISAYVISGECEESFITIVGLDVEDLSYNFELDGGELGNVEGEDCLLQYTEKHEDKLREICAIFDEFNITRPRIVTYDEENENYVEYTLQDDGNFTPSKVRLDIDGEPTTGKKKKRKASDSTENPSKKKTKSPSTTSSTRSSKSSSRGGGNKKDDANTDSASTRSGGSSGGGRGRNNNRGGSSNNGGDAAGGAGGKRNNNNNNNNGGGGSNNNGTEQEKIRKEKEALKARKAELDKREAELDEREAELDKRKTDMDEREKEQQHDTDDMEIDHDSMNDGEHKQYIYRKYQDGCKNETTKAAMMIADRTIHQHKTEVKNEVDSADHQEQLDQIKEYNTNINKFQGSIDRYENDPEYKKYRDMWKQDIEGLNQKIADTVAGFEAKDTALKKKYTDKFNITLIQLTLGGDEKYKSHLQPGQNYRETPAAVKNKWVGYIEQDHVAKID